MDNSFELAIRNLETATNSLFEAVMYRSNFITDDDDFTKLYDSVHCMTETIRHIAATQDQRNICSNSQHNVQKLYHTESAARPNAQDSLRNVTRAWQTTSTPSLRTSISTESWLPGSVA